ncbi:hypothetical protein N7537_006819 [Penicillium hordei]|uniref:F-box domain-containing protein n=1 Tax=Penicillium hordei TaxID=40994 RepID=A0AAD6H3G7_9EURO|nr:uncharacterized protein N7537_006819 [Penicillium hordei]KAJ5603863.1 hypothetical protein N7537_006819 [Penicillium hordei]
MSLLHLPTELVLMIESDLDSLKDLNSLTRTSPRFALMFDDKLYKNRTAHQHAYIILWAAKRGLHGTIYKCLNAGAKITRRDRFRSHLADRDAPEVLNVIPRHPKSHPLTAAAEIRSLSCTHLLLDQGVNPNLIDEHYETPMRQAAGNGHVHIVELLLSHDEAIFTGAFKLRRPLKIAAARGHLPVLKALISFLERKDRNLTVKDAAQIILYEGLWHRKKNVVTYALEEGADVNDENSEFVLRFAPDLRPDELPERPRPKLLQGHKIGVNIRGIITNGWSHHTPNTLHAALLGGDGDLVQLILDYGFEMARVKPILQDAIVQENTEIISQLTNLGVTLTSEMFQRSLDGIHPDLRDFLKTRIGKIMEELGLET